MCGCCGGDAERDARTQLAILGCVAAAAEREADASLAAHSRCGLMRSLPARGQAMLDGSTGRHPGPKWGNALAATGRTRQAASADDPREETGLAAGLDAQPFCLRRLRGRSPAAGGEGSGTDPPGLSASHCCCCIEEGEVAAAHVACDADDARLISIDRGAAAACRTEQRRVR